jgi:hypothetical protein
LPGNERGTSLLAKIVELKMLLILCNILAGQRSFKIESSLVHWPNAGEIRNKLK